MCGDLDEDQDALEQAAQLFARFAAHARSLLPKAGQPAQTPADITAYMEHLFVDVLARCLRDGEAVEEAGRYRQLSMQPVVLARLAGFLAGHLALGEDPLRKVMEALMLGYGEAEAMDQAHDQRHAHGDIAVRG